MARKIATHNGSAAHKRKRRLPYRQRLPLEPDLTLVENTWNMRYGGPGLAKKLNELEAAAYLALQEEIDRLTQLEFAYNLEADHRHTLSLNSATSSHSSGSSLAEADCVTTTPVGVHGPLQLYRIWEWWTAPGNRQTEPQRTYVL